MVDSESGGFYKLSLTVWSGPELLIELKSRLNVHFALSLLLYDPKATRNYRKGLVTGSLHAEAASSFLTEHETS